MSKELEEKFDEKLDHLVPKLMMEGQEQLRKDIKSFISKHYIEKAKVREVAKELIRQKPDREFGFCPYKEPSPHHMGDIMCDEICGSYDKALDALIKKLEL